MDKFKKLSPGTKLKVGTHQCIIINYFSEGGFAHIYKVQISPPENNSDIACLKRVLVKDKTGLSQLRTEVKVMQKLVGCSNIVQYYDSHASRLSVADSHESIGYEVLVLMELCPNKSLLHFMNTRLKTKLKEIEILKIMYDISLAVSQLHYLPKPLIHRDIKIENVLIDSQRNFKLCDFGSTCHVIPPPRNQTQLESLYKDIIYQTTPQYRCPEMVDLTRGFPIDEKSDIWALGVFLYKLCYYRTPFETHGEAAILSATFQFPAAPKFSPSLKNLIIIMLQANPKFRPNIYQVVDAVCKISNLTVPIHDKYGEGPYKIPYSVPNQYASNPPAAQYQPSIPVPSAGAYANLPPGFPKLNNPIAVYPQAQKEPSENQNDIKSLTQTLLQRTTEMIEESPKLSPSVKKNTSAQNLAELNDGSRFENVNNLDNNYSDDLLNSAEVRYPSVDQLHASFNYPSQYYPPQYPQYDNYNHRVPEEQYLATPGANILVPNKSNVSIQTSGNNVFYNSSSSINLTKTNDSSNDLYNFERTSSPSKEPSKDPSKEPSRQPSTKSKTSQSRPLSYVDLNSQFDGAAEGNLSTNYNENIITGDNSVNYGRSYTNDTNNQMYNNINSQKYNDTRDNYNDIKQNGAAGYNEKGNTTSYSNTPSTSYNGVNSSKSLSSTKNNDSYSHSNTHDISHNNDDFLFVDNSHYNTSHNPSYQPDAHNLLDFDSDDTYNPAQKTTNNPFPIDSAFKPGNPKNPWANAKPEVKTPFPVFNPSKNEPTKTGEQINDLLLRTKNIVNGMVDNEDGVSFDDKRPEHNESLNKQFNNLSIDTKQHSSVNLLDIESPTSMVNMKPPLPNTKSLKIRELLNATEKEVEVDLSSNSSFDDNEIAVEEEDGEKYLTKIQSTKSRLSAHSGGIKEAKHSVSPSRQSSDEFGNNDNIPMLRMPGKKSSSFDKSSPDIGGESPISPVDMLFRKEEPKKSRFSGTFQRSKLKLRTNSNSSNPLESPPPKKMPAYGNILKKSPVENYVSPIDATTKKKLGNIFSDSEDGDSIIGDIRNDDSKEPDLNIALRRVKTTTNGSSSIDGHNSAKDVKKRSRKEKMKSFLSSHHNHQSTN